jgi:hypothetical protein
MHPTIQIEIAKSRAADMQRQAEHHRVVRRARAAGAAGFARPARQRSRHPGRRPAPRALARLLRLSLPGPPARAGGRLKPAAPTPEGPAARW